MIEVAVMYVDPIGLKDTTIHRCRLNELDVLTATYGIDNVMAISVKDTEIKGKAGNIAFIFGFDHYALCRKMSGGKDFIMLFGWDDGDFVWRQISCNGCKEREEVDMPIGVMHTIFRGKSVSQSVWEVVDVKINAEML